RRQLCAGSGADPDAHRHGTPTLIRSDSAGCTQGLLAHIRGLREHGVDARFSVGWPSPSPSAKPSSPHTSGYPPWTPPAVLERGGAVAGREVRRGADPADVADEPGCFGRADPIQVGQATA